MLHPQSLAFACLQTHICTPLTSTFFPPAGICFFFKLNRTTKRLASRLAVAPRQHSGSVAHTKVPTSLRSGVHLKVSTIYLARRAELVQRVLPVLACTGTYIQFMTQH
jgi:hypothetical protein